MINSLSVELIKKENDKNESFLKDHSDQMDPKN